MNVVQAPRTRKEEVWGEMRKWRARMAEARTSARTDHLKKLFLRLEQLEGKLNAALALLS